MKLGKKIGTGATADIYEYEENKVFKQFHEDQSENAIRYEYNCGQAVQKLGIRVPEMYELVIEKEMRGYIMEYIHGESLLGYMLQLMQKEDGDKELEEICRQFAKIQYQMHQTAVTGLPEGNQWLKNRIERCKDLNQEEIDQMCTLVDQLPQGNVLCHNDYHPGNLMITKDGYCVIDWCDATVGTPWMDVARTMFVFKSVNAPESLSEEEIRRLNQARRKMGEIYLHEYLSFGQQDETELKKWMPVVAASRIANENGKDKEMFLQIVRNCLAKS